MLGRSRASFPIAFISTILCVAGVYAALTLASSVFPQTDFPRVVILVDNGVMPADEMMATITRPIEESMKGIRGVSTIKSATGRGAAEINVFFTWRTDMIQAELFVLGRLAQIRATLPASAQTNVYRLTFSAFPILGVSLTSDARDVTQLWETARYDLRPRFLRIPGVARVDLVGGRAPEYHVIADPIRLAAANVSLATVADALAQNNVVAPAGMHEESHDLYLTVVDGRVHTARDLEDFVVAYTDGHPVRVRDVGRVERGPEPVFNVVTADGHDAVLLNIRSQPDGSTLQIARDLRREIADLRRELPPDMKVAFFYDQSEIVRSSVRSVWEAILFGIVLSICILYFFLGRWRTTLVAIAVIPVTVLLTLVAMKLAGLTFNLMTLGGIAAAIGLVIDDAIVVVEVIHTHLAAGMAPEAAVERGIREILRPLVGSTLTPVVVFIPLAFLGGITGVFFRALAMTMVVSLLASLVLAVTLTPMLASWLLDHHGEKPRTGPTPAERIVANAGGLYERAVRTGLRHPLAAVAICGGIFAAGLGVYAALETEFLPPLDEGGFVIDYFTPPGTSLQETNRQLLAAEAILRRIPEVESYSRRTGARLALAIAEPNTGDFLVKLRTRRRRSTEAVIEDLRERFNRALPGVNWEFPGILGDLVGDLLWAPEPIEVKLFSPDQHWLEQRAPEVAAKIEKLRGVVDVFDGLVYTGPSIVLRVRSDDAGRVGLSAADIARNMNAALLGEPASAVLDGDRLITVRVQADSARIRDLEQIENLPLRAPGGALVKLSQVADVVQQSGQLELHREDSRQEVAVTARLEGRDLGSAMAEIRSTLGRDPALPREAIEYGGLYLQQRESFTNLLMVLLWAVALVFLVLLLEFGSFAEPIAIVFGAILAMFGTVLALWLTHTSFNVVSFLGAIIGIGITAKNGILLLDSVHQLRDAGVPLEEALVRSGRRRLRPVLMTSLAAALGMLPLAWGIGSGADMLRPLAIAVIGALAVSIALSLVATPALYYLLRRRALER